MFVKKQKCFSWLFSLDRHHFADWCQISNILTFKTCPENEYVLGKTSLPEHLVKRILIRKQIAASIITYSDHVSIEYISCKLYAAHNLGISHLHKVAVMITIKYASISCVGRFDVDKKCKLRTVKQIRQIIYIHI